MTASILILSSFAGIIFFLLRFLYDVMVRTELQGPMWYDFVFGIGPAFVAVIYFTSLSDRR